LKELIIATALQRTLEFMVQNPGRSFHDRDVGRRHPLAEAIKAVILTPAQFLKLRTREKEFYREIQGGLVLWEKSRLQG